MQRYHAILVELAAPTNTTFQAIVRQLASRMVRSGGSDPVTAQQQAMAAVDGIISTHARTLRGYWTVLLPRQPASMLAESLVGREI